MTKRKLALLITLGILSSGGAYSATTISDDAPYAWSANTGWIDMRGDGQYGVVVSHTCLYGNAWAENIGWISFGNQPLNNTAYTQTAGDTGVNRDPFTGRLSGYAWGENIGWISFNDHPGGGGTEVVCTPVGTFTGYAWSGNIGWINFGTQYGVKTEPLGSNGSGWMLLGS